MSSANLRLLMVYLYIFTPGADSMQRTQESAPGVKIYRYTINNLKFADDIDLIEKNCITFQESLDLLIKTDIEYGLEVDIYKTKVMVFGSKSMKNNIKLNGEEGKAVNQFAYLGSLLSAGGCEKEIKRRMAVTCGPLADFGKVWRCVWRRLVSTPNIASFMIVYSVYFYTRMRHRHCKRKRHEDLTHLKCHVTDVS